MPDLKILTDGTLLNIPMVAIGLTLLAYYLGNVVYVKSGKVALLNPIIIAFAIVCCGIIFSGSTYDRYFSSAQAIHLLLGPATICFAVPLYRNLATIKRAVLPITVSILAGSLVSIVAVIVVAKLFGADKVTIISLMPKSVTTPVALGISEKLGGLPSITVVIVMISGLTGVLFGPYLLNVLGVKDSRARGMAIGAVSHALGVARALSVDEKAGAFASIAMGLTAITVAILAPILLLIFF